MKKRKRRRKERDEAQWKSREANEHTRKRINTAHRSAIEQSVCVYVRQGERGMNSMNKIGKRTHEKERKEHERY